MTTGNIGSIYQAGIHTIPSSTLGKGQIVCMIFIAKDAIECEIFRSNGVSLTGKLFLQKEDSRIVNFKLFLNANESLSVVTTGEVHLTLSGSL